MADETWRDRLELAIERSGKSMRDISIAADCSPGYLHGILKGSPVTGPKEPGLDRLMRIVEQLDDSLPYILFGIDLGAKQFELIRRFTALPSEEQEALLNWISVRYPNPPFQSPSSHQSTDPSQPR